MNTLISIWTFAQPYLSKVYAYAPFPCGILVGYLGHPFIKLAIDVIWKLL